MLDLTLERFKRLPPRPGATWLGGVYHLPAWVKTDDDKPFRLTVALWLSPMEPEVSQPRTIEPDEDAHRAALDALLEFGSRVGRPMAIQVNSPELAQYLGAALMGTGTRVDYAATLPVMQEMLNDLAAHIRGREEPPPALSGAGVSLEQMTVFAEAAAAYYRARPWTELGDEDLIAIEQPAAPQGMEFACVLGHGGHTFGLGFFESLDHCAKMQAAASPGRFFARNGAWSLVYGDITGLPFADADLWEKHHLTVAGEEAYPAVLWFGPKKRIQRPDAAVLGFVEGLLRALAVTSITQLDSGRWSQSVTADRRQVEYRLALVDPGELAAARPRRAQPNFDPQLIHRSMEKHSANMGRLVAQQDFESVDALNDFIKENATIGVPPAVPPCTPLEAAQEVIYEAWEQHGRRKRMLARRALEISPDCADAYVLLAEDTCDPQAAHDLFEQGIAAGRRALGERYFEEHVGQFWRLLETRAFMRAAAGRAQCLWALGREDEAVSQYQELLALNPDDNQGIRYLLGACLLETGDNDRLGKLLDDHGDEPTAQWRYLRALWAYRKEGNTPQARQLAKAALKTNRFVPAFLTGRRPLPESPPAIFSVGREDEAVCCAFDQQTGWQATKGALQWLRAVAAGKKK